uniref:Cell wall binding repeat protein n=1 Tax=Pseudomonas phage HRDY3 TaxID=3236930 RepID=A0AB39CDX7_9VIRU
MKDCSSIPVIAPQHLEPKKITAVCGNWITLCGKGKHKVSYFLGFQQGPVTVWFDKENIEDEIYVYQNGEIIAAAPLKVSSGSFSFDYSPLDQNKGSDEIILTHEGQSRGSRVHIHLLCPVDPCLPAVVPVPSPVETTIGCGRQWHQAGYVKKNTILLGDSPGRVDVIWTTVGNALVQVFQDKTLLFTMTADRDEVFTFDYDPEKGDVYLLTQGTGSVDYIFTCPYKEETPEIPTYKFVCDATEDYVFNAPQLTELELPVRIGTIDFRVTLVETAQLIFSQNNVPFYVVSGHSGTVEFSYDYQPDKGKVTINAQGYGQIAVFAKCPYTSPDPIPVDIDAECGTTLNTYPGYSNITMDMNNISGPALLDVIVTETAIEIIHGTTQYISESGTYQLTYDRSLPLLIKARGNDFQMRISCPVRQPVTGTIDCGIIRSFDSYSNITVRYGSTPGNTTITTSQDVSVYRDNVLVGFGRNVTFFYPGTGVVKVVCDVLDEYLTIQASCPAVKVLPCGDQLVSFNGGDIIDVSFATPNIRGHVEVKIEITGQVTAVFRVGSTLVKTVSASETFTSLWNTADGLRIVTTGTGTFKLYVKCAVPIYIVSQEEKTEQVPCGPGETNGGVPDGDPFVIATWTVTTWSDGSTTSSPKTYNGVCKLVDTEAPMGIPRWGVAMFANRLFTGGPIASEITQEEQAYGVVANPSPSGRNYTHWTGIQQFADQVMTNQFNMSATEPGIIEPTITVDDFVYVMWDKRAGTSVKIINLGNNFEVEFEGILWRNDLLGNYEGLPGYNPALPIYLTVQYDDGNGVRDWVIIRQETTTLPEFSPRTDRYSIQYKV